MPLNNDSKAGLIIGSAVFVAGVYVGYKIRKHIHRCPEPRTTIITVTAEQPKRSLWSVLF